MVRPQMGSMTRWFLVLLSGCSMALSGPSPDRPRYKAPQCDTSKSMVVIDSLIAATLGIVAISVASSNGGAAILPAIGGGVFAASAIHGNNVVNACHRELANYDGEIASAQLPANPDAPPARPPITAMQPAVALPSQPVEAPPPQPPQVRQEQPPQPAPHSSSADPWAAFWKEAP